MKIDNDPVSSFYFSSFPSSPEKKSSPETVVKVNSSNLNKNYLDFILLSNIFCH